ncbi:ABC transporter permease subunit [Streptomyces sp. 549]|uniref:ABC transporter permease subunit n=1 Tax=Streptomyces sp. 549 TaxID=3049076 RepID=UPI0024C211BF|nr:ABC transporter permease subunit [Streptomyces sp. 549]MDK1474864.1 ABC transporter permease subunit [Streptomyces sp. 549]
MAHTTRVLQSEWTKVRTIQSTIWTLVAAFGVTVGLGMLLSLLISVSFDELPREQQVTFDATATSFSGMILGQLAVIAFGVLVVSSEYSTGMIRASLGAVPQRGTLMATKTVVATALVFVVGVITAFTSFLVSQPILGDRGTSLGEPNVLRAVFGAALFMTLMALFSMGVAWMLRSPLLSLGILMPFFFLISTILGSIETTRKVAQFLPDQAGYLMMMVVDDNVDRPYGTVGGLLIMVAWTAAALIGGYVVLKRRDA